MKQTAEVHEHKRKKLTTESNPEPLEEPSSEDDSASGEGSDGSSYDDSEDEIDYIKNLNLDKNGRPTSGRNHLSFPEDLGAVNDQEDGPIRSDKTQKRKRRARSPTSFGLVLSQALKASEKSNATGPSTTLHPATRQANRIAKQQAASESQRRQSAATRHELQERGHIKDVIGGWTPRPAVPFSEWLVQGNRKWSDEGAYVGGASQETTLRRLAQTGVVKLFNAIRAAQNIDDQDSKAALATLSGAQKRKLNKLVGEKNAKKALENGDTPIAPEVPEGEGTVGRFKPNVLGSRGKDEALANLSKATFLELIKSGGKPS
ncbi:hypothetical protein MJO28_008998 [Puccinia striiformis f. sp. tritici]|uniref:Rrp15p-domain-containing protein n=4 Tax=Puccinia striiformis TaxID=27350 RepID=A0A0L0V4Q4_9BASI|nr:hypothetical protein Pst134EA_014986 [Puccinia striiformis f. sp. tritici]KAI9603282.1 hypothetical protein H4Q26_002600 [Puccinia striiformis f. sp. tritici PST-130]KNE94171.1 hypothetical protein PSTG_12502 [Puccinia striiformis f. sp. tritici PST-78]POV95797.1 hypothetical protein PSTT_16057 [Puccinia striiformis]KAH9452149.1 hypothetical protein Pst134EB_016107 [Puccinia striiformis f. sp. tritici]KAH9462898.1 hypothetical protein Pst134EA_014986 [Puccinia striiformis f. sp. tritici]